MTPTDASALSQANTSSRVTVAGGGKGHTLGRASRKQLATLLCAIWRPFFDAFGAAVPGAPGDGELMLEVCDATAELSHIEGAPSLLRWWRPRAQPSTPSVSSSASSAAAPANKAVSDIGSDNDDSSSTRSTDAARPFFRPPAAQSAAQQGAPQRRMPPSAVDKPNTLPAPQGVLRVHANTAWALAERVSEVRAAVASASEADKFAPALDHCGAWPAVHAALQAAWGGDETHVPAYSFVNPLLSCSSVRSAGDGQNTARAIADAGQAHSDAGSISRHSAHSGVVVSRDEIAQRVLLTFGLWCVAALLQLSAVEPRPELWGRYVAALNHLQGVLLATRCCAASALDAVSGADRAVASPGAYTHGAKRGAAACRRVRRMAEQIMTECACA